MSKFTPNEVLDEDDDDGTMVANVETLANEVIGHRIVSVEQVEIPQRLYGDRFSNDRTEVAHRITLDNGTTVDLVPGGDCCAYTELEAFLLHPESVDHVITGVRTSGEYTTWSIFADFGDVLTLTVGWSAGNPFYYGYGFDIRVTTPVSVTA